MYCIWLTTSEHRAVIAPQDRNTPAEVLELPTKTDRIHHFAWEPHVSAVPPHPSPMHGCRATAGHQSDAALQDLTPVTMSRCHDDCRHCFLLFMMFAVAKL